MYDTAVPVLNLTAPTLTTLFVFPVSVSVSLYDFPLSTVAVNVPSEAVPCAEIAPPLVDAIVMFCATPSGRFVAGLTMIVTGLLIIAQ